MMGLSLFKALFIYEVYKVTSCSYQVVYLSHFKLSMSHGSKSQIYFMIIEGLSSIKLFYSIYFTNVYVSNLCVGRMCFHSRWSFILLSFKSVKSKM